jgi:hypothetical protein
VNLVVSSGPADITASAIDSLDPLDEATDADIAANLVVTFDENITAGTGVITLKNLTDATDSTIGIDDGSQVSISGSVLTIDPATDLAEGKDYAIQIDATAIDDASANSFVGIANDTTWNFTTKLPLPMVDLFSEDFESPSTPTAYSEGTLPSNGNWVKATEGYGATKHGITDKAGGDFSAADPNHQAYAFRYTNSGFTSAVDALADLTAGATYRISFDVVRDSGAGAGTPYRAQLIAFGSGDARNDCRSTPAGSLLLKDVSGSATSDGLFTRVAFTYTTGDIVDNGHLNSDLGLRFVGGTTSAIIDNILVEGSEIGGDVTAPTLASTDIIDDQSGGTVEINTMVTYTVTFSEDMDASTVDASDFSNAPSAAVTVGSVIETSPGVFAVEVTPTTMGDLQLQVNAGAVLTDLAGNALDTIAASADDTVITVLSEFQSWAGGITPFSTDTNNDGVPDGLAWLLGANEPSANAQSLTPQGNSNIGGDLIMTFNCLNAANRGSAVMSVQYSQDMGVTDLWTNHTAVIPESSGTVNEVIFVITPNGNVNEVQATVPAGAGSSIFGRILGDTLAP